MVLLKIVIDLNLFSPIFNCTDSSHGEFKCIYNLLLEKRELKLTYGGTKYLDEINKLTKYRSFLVELKRSRQLEILDAGQVDEIEKRIGMTYLHYNDYHIAAIVIVGRCPVVCSLDQRLHKLLDKKIYDGRMKKPFIFSNKNHKDGLRLILKEHKRD